MAAASQLQVPIKGKLLSLRLKKGQIDKAHKDKTSQRFPDNFSVTLFLVKPEDQSEKLLDYSLYSPAFLMQSMPDQVGILLLLDILLEFWLNSFFCSSKNSTNLPKLVWSKIIVLNQFLMSFSFFRIMKIVELQSQYTYIEAFL